MLSLSSCFQTQKDASVGSNDSSDLPSATSGNKNVSVLLQGFKGGTIDLRSSEVFKVKGSYSKDKLIQTQLTIRGEGKGVISSDRAIAFTGKGKKIILGTKGFRFFTVEEHFDGKLIKTRLSNSDGQAINYRLKL